VLAAAGGTQGGGTELTETGRALIALYRGIEAQAREACRSDIRRLMTLLAA
jgi:molybdate transport system regulatory protein